MTEALNKAAPAPLQAASAPWFGDRQAALLLRYAAALYAVAWVIHTGDHVRRGVGVLTSRCRCSAAAREWRSC